MKLVATLMTNTRGEGKIRPFLGQSRKVLACVVDRLYPLCGLRRTKLRHTAGILNVMEVREDDEEFQNKVDEYEQEQKPADKFIVLVNK